jgi:hypothetical protein
VRNLLVVTSIAGALFAFAPTGCSSDPDKPVENDAGTQSQLIFRDPETCRPCHEQHVNDWSGSMHAYAAKDPLFHGIADVMISDFAGEKAAEQFCTQCHTVPGTFLGETKLEKGVGGSFTIKTEGLSKVAQHGVSCDVCHSAARVNAPFNANITFEPTGTIRGPFGNPVETPAHPSVESPLHRTGELCAGCHNVKLPGSEDRAVPLESTGKEWVDYRSKGGEKHCQDCHMPVRGEGPAAPGGPNRQLHAHTFVGVDIALIDDFPDKERQRTLVEKLLREAVELSSDVVVEGGKPIGATVSLKNLAGHAVPSGATTERRMWLEAKLADASGAVVWETGKLDSNGDLMDGYPEHSVDPKGDPELWWFGANVTFTSRDEGTKLVAFPHQSTEIAEKLLRPLTTESHTFKFPTTLAAGSYSLKLRVLYRSLQPFFMRELEKHFLVKLDPKFRARVPTMTMAEQMLAITIP